MLVSLKTELKIPSCLFTFEKTSISWLINSTFEELTSKTENGYMLEVEDYGSVDPSQVVRFKN